MSEIDEVTMKQEIMLEAYAGILAGFHEYFDKIQTDPYEATVRTPEIFMFMKARDIKLSILKKKTVKEMDEIIGQFKLFKAYLEELENESNQ